MEEDEELGLSESNEDGLQTLLHDVEDLLESSGIGNSTDDAIHKDGRKGTEKLTPRNCQKSIHQSLSAMNAPSELREATALLLQSSLLDDTTALLLTRKILDQPMEEADELPIEQSNDSDGKSHHDNEEAVGEEEANTNTQEDATESGTSNDDAVVFPTTEDETTQKDESTSLLGASSENDEILKPSIFTMHSMTPPEE